VLNPRLFVDRRVVPVGPDPRLFVDRRVVPVGPDPLLSDDRRVRAGLLPFTRAQRVDLHLGRGVKVLRVSLEAFFGHSFPTYITRRLRRINLRQLELCLLLCCLRPYMADLWTFGSRLAES